MRALAIGLAFLGLCVFVWGLNYKLSLYDPPHSISHHMPAAKLLTGKERNTPALPLAPPPVRSVVPMAFSTLVVIPLMFAATQSRLTLRRCSLLFVPVRFAPAFARSTSSFVRPPPYLL